MSKIINNMITFLIVCLFASSCNVPNNVKTSISMKMPNIKIIADRALSNIRKEINYEKSYIVMEYKDGNPIFYEYKHESLKGVGEYLTPKLNKDGTQTQLHLNDDEFESKLKMTLHPSILASIEQNKIEESPKELAVGIKAEDNWIYNVYKYKIENDKYINWMHAEASLKIEEENLLPRNSLTIIDNNFNFQILKYTGKDFEKIKTEAINPDFYLIHDIPGFNKMDEIPYKGGYYEGYIWMKTFSNKVCVWKEYEEIPHPLLILSENNQPAVDMYSLARFMLTPTSGDMKTLTFHRLYRFHSSHPVEYITATFELGKNYAIVNGERKELEFTPFEKDDIFYVPLRDLCKFIKAPCHYRTTDNSALVARFFAPMNE